MGSDVNAQYIPEETDPAKIIVELCQLFYSQGWLSGTAGGMSIKDGDRIYTTPSGVQKERMRPGDLTIYDLATHSYVEGSTKLYKPSACVPLFKAVFNQKGAGACIHVHSVNAVLVTLLFRKTFRISNIENIKAIPRGSEAGNLGFFDTLEIPIIENAAHEEELEPALTKVLEDNPSAPAILVRRHGLFTWGRDVWKAKVINEALDYLFEVAIKMKQFNIEPDGAIGSEFAVDKGSQYQ